jgi:hypothetical protein
MWSIEKKRAWDRAYAKRNRKRLSKYNLEYYHRTNRKEYAKKWYHSDLELHRKKRRENNLKRRLKVLKMIGGKCVKCGFSDWRALHIDHVNGDGNKHRKETGRMVSPQFWERIIKEGKYKLQILCANCNYIKRHENREMYKHD